MTERKEAQNHLWQELELKLQETTKLFDQYPAAEQLDLLIANEEPIDLQGSVYIPTRVATVLSDMGEVYVYDLHQIPVYEALNPGTPIFISLKYDSRDRTLKNFSFGFRRGMQQEGVLFQLAIRVNKDKVTRILQMALPNVYLDLNDSLYDRQRNQEITCDFTYSEEGLASVALRFGYPERQFAELIYKRERGFQDFGYSVDERSDIVSFAGLGLDGLASLVNNFIRQKPVL